MTEGSILGSLDRIEAALERIETAARARVTPARDADLEHRHAALKGAVETALARLDMLIAEQP